jgi:hypothetical protein
MEINLREFIKSLKEGIDHNDIIHICFTITRRKTDITIEEVCKNFDTIFKGTIEDKKSFIKMLSRVILRKGNNQILSDKDYENFKKEICKACLEFTKRFFEKETK